MYKTLEMFSAEQIEEMRAICAQRKAEIERLNQIALDVCK